MGLVSRTLRCGIAEGMHSSLQSIFSQPSTGGPLCRYIEELKERYPIGQQSRDLSLQAAEISHCWNAHASLLKEIRALGVYVCRSKILFPREVAQYRIETTQRKQDGSLRKAWKKLRQEIGVNLPVPNRAVEDVRVWMGENRSAFQNLTTLYLHKLDLECVPKEIRLLTGLKKLNLDHNRLTFFDAGAVQGLTDLQILELSCNQLTSLDAGAFRGLSALLELDLYGNQLASVEAGTFQDLSALKKLILANNMLTSVNSGTFHGLGALRRLDLGWNQLTQIEVNAFLELRSLDVLRLNDNLLTSFAPGTFQNLSNVEDLQINSNRLISLEDGVFQGLEALDSLDLNNVTLCSIGGGSFQGLPKLRRVQVASKMNRRLIEMLKTLAAEKGFYVDVVF
jgi:hypothetical protein